MNQWLFDPAVSAFLRVVMVDIVLAGDNAVVVALVAAGLPPEQRARAIVVGIVAATVIRIALTLVATELMQVIGLMLAGGILLLWVCWKMWRELAVDVETGEGAEAPPPAEGSPSRRPAGRSSSPTCRCRSTTFSPSPGRRASTRR